MSNGKMPSEVPFNPEHYLKGRVALPPQVLSYPSEPFIYGGDLLVNNGASAKIDIQINDDSHFLVEAINILPGIRTAAQAKATVQFTDTTTSRSWSSLPVNLRDISGIGADAKYISHPNILRPTTTLSCQINNNIGANSQFYVSLIGRKIYNLPKELVDFLTRRLWYQYVMAVPPLAAGAVNIKADMQIYNESDFLVNKLLSYDVIEACIAGAGGAVSDELMVIFKDTTTDKSLFNQSIAARLIFGSLFSRYITTAANGFSYGSAMSLKKPWLIRRNGKISGYWDNLSAAPVANSMLAVFEGIRLFDAA